MYIRDNSHEASGKKTVIVLEIGIKVFLLYSGKQSGCILLVS